MIIEMLVIAMLIFSGALTLRCFGLKKWPLLPLGLLTGMALFTVFVFIQAASGIYISAFLPIVLTLLTPFAFAIYKVKTGGKIDFPSIKELAIGSIGVVVLVSIFYQLNLYSYHYDSLRYLMVGGLIHDDGLLSVSTNLLEKRFSTVSALHSLGNFTSNYHVRSLTPLVSLSVLTIIGWFLVTELRTKVSRSSLLMLISAAILLLISSHNYVFHSFYINGHLISGAYMLVISIIGWMQHQKNKVYSEGLLLTIQSFAIIGLTLSRVEGLLYVLIVLLPTLLSNKIKPLYKKIISLVYAGSIVLQQLVVVIIKYKLDRPIPSYSKQFALFALGIALVALVLFGQKKLFKEPAKLLWLVEASLWLVLGLLFIRNQSVLKISLNATFQNIAVVPAPWGLSLVMLMVIFALLLVFYRFKDQIFLRFPVTAFVPIVLILAYLREGAYRVAAADSLNRILIQVVPLLVLFIVVSMALGKNKFKKLDPILK